MCTAYRFETSKDGVRLPTELLGPASTATLTWSDAAIIRPTHQAPVLLANGQIETQTWGFRRQFRGKKGPVSRSVVNAREDNLDSPMWRRAFAHHRCLIPATAFYEWIEDAAGRSVPLECTPNPSPNATATEPCLWIAGLWEQAETQRHFSMITTEPTPDIGKYHDRMPAVLAPEQRAPYLRGELNHFGPSPVPLHFSVVPNFLRKRPS